MSRGNTATDYWICGWRVRSALPLPGLVQCDSDAAAADIVISFGTVAAEEGLVPFGPFMEIDTAGIVVLRQPSAGTFHVRRDRVVIDPAVDADDGVLRLFLLGSALGFLCHLRGVLPLHASCIAIDGRAVAFSGPSGAGKSTTALHAVRRGHTLLADDLCVLDGGDPMVIHPTVPRLKLWADALDAAAIDPAPLARNRAGQRKYLYSPDSRTPTPSPLAAIVFLAAAAPGAPATLTRMTSPFDVTTAITGETYRRRTGTALGNGGAMFAIAAAVTRSVPVFRLSRARDIAAIDGWMAEIEAAVAP